jgi:putative transposase
VSKCAPQQALRNLDVAYKRFFKGLKSKKKTGFPKRKKKGNRDSFYLEGSFKIEGTRIKVPKLGWLQCHENLPQAAPKNCVISRRADRWYISFATGKEPKPTPKIRGIVGVDLGITLLAKLSSGVEFLNPRPLQSNLKRLARYQKKLARQKKGGQNRKKTKAKIARLHARIANIRKDSLHKITSYLAKNHSQIVIEDLNVSGMLKNRKLAAKIADVGFHEFRRQLTYKCAWYGSEIIVVDRWFPSSKTCSACGVVKDKLDLSERIFSCGSCGHTLCRDLNAAINLENAGSLSVSACGECVSLPNTRKQRSMKQELNAEFTKVDLGRF